VLFVCCAQYLRQTRASKSLKNQVITADVSYQLIKHHWSLYHKNAFVWRPQANYFGSSFPLAPRIFSSNIEDEVFHVDVLYRGY